MRVGHSEVKTAFWVELRLSLVDRLFIVLRAAPSAPTLPLRKFANEAPKTDWERCPPVPPNSANSAAALAASCSTLCAPRKSHPSPGTWLELQLSLKLQ